MDNRYSGYKRRSSSTGTGFSVSESYAAGRKRSALSIKLTVSLVIFALAFLTKLAFPGASTQIKSAFLPVLERNTDYTAAFSSMGRFFSGEASFADAFREMTAFLIFDTGTVKTSAPEDPEIGTETVTASEYKTGTLPDPSAENPLSGAFSSGALFSENSELSQNALLENEKADEAATVPEISMPPQSAKQAPDTASEDAETPGEAAGETAEISAVFLESQEIFGGVPEDVNARIISLPFDYTRPAPGEINSGFGFREHPIDEETKFHYGVDFNGSEGDAVYAFAEGHIAASGYSESIGYYLIVSHGDGYTTQYFHCSRLIAEGGEYVEAGEKIAEIGETGYTTGPHLHFEILFEGDYLNPEYFISSYQHED